jgi:hypothetical protein
MCLPSTGATAWQDTGLLVSQELWGQVLWGLSGIAERPYGGRRNSEFG